MIFIKIYNLKKRRQLKVLNFCHQCYSPSRSFWFSITTEHTQNDGADEIIIPDLAEKKCAETVGNV